MHPYRLTLRRCAVKNLVAEIRASGEKNNASAKKISTLPATLVVLGLILAPSIASAQQKLQSNQVTRASDLVQEESVHRKGASLISMGRSSLEVFDNSLVFMVTEDVTNRRATKKIRARFIREIATYLSQYRKAGYDRKAAYMAAEALYKSSLSQKLIAEGHIQKVATIRGVVSTVDVDAEGRIHFGEMIQYKPHQPIYCAKEGKPSVPRNSAIPCLTKKRKGKGKRLGKLPQEALRIVNSWRDAQKQQQSSRKKTTSQGGGNDVRQKYLKQQAFNRRLMRLPDAQLWAALWSSGKKTLLAKYTFKPIFLIPPIDFTKIPIPQQGRSLEMPLLAGFTVDQQDGWLKRWDTTVEVCFWWDPWNGWSGCVSSYYYIEPYYNYSYLYGLRIPMALNASTSQVKKTGSKYTGKITTDLDPFNGNAGDYADTGLPANLIYGGREILASLCHKNCGAGVRGDLPGPKPWPDVLPINVNIGEVNLLSKLPNTWPIKTGQLNPPDVGGNEMLGQTKIEFDLLFGQANAGVAGAKLYPWLRLDMQGKRIRIQLEKQKRTDCSQVNAGYYRKLTYNNPNPITKDFSLHNNKNMAFENHDYTFNLKLRPGLGPEVWVDLGVWSDDWSYGPWYFPWGLDSPSYTLDRHPNTYCAVNFKVTN